MTKYRKSTKFEDKLLIALTSLGVASWFAACWIFHIQFFLTGLFAFLLCIIMVGSMEIKPKTSEDINQELEELRSKATKKTMKELRKHLKEQTKKKKVKK